tara:strand:- start:2436 stop:2687 length:252 start_codon:yes stop_codon:yes gene_type:complete
MNCPNCNAQLSRSMGRVTQVRHTGKNAISRQRTCNTCGHAWATCEVIVPDEAIADGTWRMGGFAIKDEVIDELVLTGNWFKSA